MNRPKLRPVLEEMRNLSFLLGEEILRWPDVTMRPMFGMRAYYRRGVVFAMLPDKRALEDPNGFAYKLAAGAEKREDERWKLFVIKSASELSAALAVLDQAYRKAARAARR